MQKYNTLEDCIDLTRFARRKQYDKDGIDYFYHPVRVLNSVQDAGAMPHVQMAAVLHDVTENTAFSCEMLLELGVPEAAVDIVRLVDRDASLSKWERISETNTGFSEYPVHVRTADDFYYYEIKNNPGALQVKLADIEDILQQWRLALLPADKRERLKAECARAIELLTG